MNTRAFTLSLIIAAISVLMVYSYIDGEEAKLAKRYGNPKTVIIAKQNIQAYELLDDKKVMIAKVPEKFVAPGSITSIEDINNTVASVPILKGEQITKPRVTYPNVKTGLSRQVSPGRRAIALPIDSANAIAKLIKPGDRVDVIAKIDYAGGQKDKVLIKTILQDVLVLSTGKNISNSIPLSGVKTPREIRLMNLDTYSNFNEVTVELSPDESQKVIWLLTDNAKFFLTLRNNDDRDLAKVAETTIFDLMGEDATKAKQYFQRSTAGRNR